MNRITTYIRQSLQGIYPPEELQALSMLICCDMLGLDAIDLYAGKDITLSESKQCELKNIIFRLQKNEPIQYIRGYAEFCGSMFRVAPGVLIPRLETAGLVELIVKENPQARRVLDIGTGSGCIAVSLDKKLLDATVDAWDISEEALTIARRNNEELGTCVSFYRRDVLADYKKEKGEKQFYDVIVSNPPYVRESEKQEMELNVLGWEPELALFVSDEDPLLFYRGIAQRGAELLLSGGKLYVEINQSYGRETARLLEEYQYRNTRVVKDLFGKDRIVTANR